MNAFLPPGAKVRGNDSDPRVARCLERREVYDVSVLQSGEDLFFVRFFPVLARCGLDATVLDADAVYAVDGKGRILGMD